MKKKLFNILLVFALGASSLGIAAESSNAVSKMRIKKITDVIRRYSRAGEDLSDPDVKAAINQEVGEMYPLEPEEKPTRMSTKEIAKIVRAQVNDKFPDSLEEVKKKAEEEAKKKFTMHKVLDYVFVRYEQGRKSYEAEGVFYNYGIGGNSINVGGRIIPIFDLLPDYRIKFDEAYNIEKKREFIQDHVRNYFRRKTQYSGGMFREIRDRISQENEKTGYIYAWNDWRSAMEVTDTMIKGILTHQQNLPEEGRNDFAMPIDDDPGNQDDGSGEGTETTRKDPLQLQIAKVKKKAEKQKIVIANTFTGIDADQGYGLASWGMSHEEVNLLFYPDIPKDSQKTLETLAFNEGPVASVELYFLNNVFYKTVINFRIAHNEAMGMLWTRISESYGRSEEEKLIAEEMAELQARSDAIRQKTDPPPSFCHEIMVKNKKTKKEEPKKHDYKDGICKVCGHIKPREIPINQTFTWPGKITTGVLEVQLSNDRSAYQRFSLIKENQELRKEIEAEIESERLRKAEEDRKRQEELYKDPLNL